MEEHKEEIVALINSLKNNNASIRNAACDNLVKIGKNAKHAIPLIASLLNDEKSEVKGCAAWVLGEIGPVAFESVPALVNELKNNKYGNRRCDAAEALGKIGPIARDAIPTMLKILEDKTLDANTGEFIIRAIGKIGTAEPEKVIPTLIRFLHCGSEFVRGAAAVALGRIGNKSVERELEIAMACENSWIVYSWIADALKEIKQK